VDGRADVYSLGRVLFHCLAGRAPYVGDTEYAVLHAHVSDRAPLVSSERADLPRALDAVLLKALAKDPVERYATAGALADALGAAVEATRAAPVVASPPRPRRRWLPAAIAALVVLAVAGALGAVLATRGSNHDAAPAEPSLRATVLAIEHILRGSAAERHSVGNVLDAGFNCRIGRSEASSRMRDAATNRRRALDDVARIGTPPAAATKAVALLRTALNHSIRADAEYRNGFRYATGPCPPTSGYFKSAAQEDRQATQAKIRFVAAFNPLAMRFGRKLWTAAAI
jgi:hypothetical protein